MNTVLQTGYDQLRQEERNDLRGRLSDSPRAIRLLDFLEERKGRKFNTVDAVETIYDDEADEEFTTLRNRYFKLRKHILSLLDGETSKGGSGVILLPLEEELFRCRQMINGNHFNQVRKQLKELIAECKRLNVFEVLPEAINLNIYCNLALNNFRDHERRLSDLEESSKLLDDLRTIQAISRRIYMAVITRDMAVVGKHLQAMRRIVLRRSAFPRFELYYHFTVVTNAAAVQGYSGKGHARHLASLKKMMNKYPGMPAGSYEPNGPALIHYYLLIADGSHHYMRGEVQQCYSLFQEAWEIQERIPNLRIRKSESNFKNKMAIEVATGRYREAVKTAQELIDFHKEHKQDEKRLNGFAELAVVYSYAFPSMKCPNPDFLTQQLKTYTALLKRGNADNLGDVLSTQAIFAFMCKDWKAAKKIMSIESAKKVFRSMGLEVYNEFLVLSPASGKEKVVEMKRKIHGLLDRTVSADILYSLRRALNLVLMLEVECGK
ncbi:MAG TPA: hypothetical protein VK826_00715 [Bacteroidia bacterium]|nr:hypothetical protein [Bacteroidia bacterium]